MKKIYASIALLVSTLFFLGAFFVFLMYITTTTSGIGWFIYISLSVLSVLIWLAIFLYSDSKNKLPWLFIIAIFPIIGVFAYLMLGQGFKETIRFKKRLKQLGPNFVFKEQSFLQDKNERLSELSTGLAKLNKTTCETSVSFKTQTTILTNGDQKFPLLLDVLRGAKSFIFIEYYIFNSDRIGTEMINILVEKVKEGVEVRLLYDPMGTGKKMESEAVSKMRDAGVKVAQFDPVLIPFLSSKVNHRNHRKIVIVDGELAISGGINVGDEYLHRAPRYPFWRDSSILLKGEAVYQLAVIFAGDWFFATGERLEDDKYFDLHPVESSGAVQVIDSGPQSSIANIKQCFFRMIMSAKKSVYIITPYLIPDVDILSALKNAALSGIDVRIIVPGFPDRLFVYLATQSYFEQLLEVGVRIFTYDAVFCHSKIMVIDEEIASIGTTNMDIRSFYLNFEVNVVLYETESIQVLLNDFNIDLSRSTEIFYDEWKQRSIFIRSAQSLAQLFSPIM